MKNKVLITGQLHRCAGPIRRASRYVLLLWISLLGVATSGTLLAQTPDTTKQRPIIRPSVPLPGDTLTPEMATDNNALLVDSLLVDSDSSAVDTVQLSAKVNAEIRKIVPKRATLLSLALPGLGQIYNGQKWKVPVIYAGFGTFGYFIYTLGQKYHTYLAGYTEAYSTTVAAGQDPNRTKVAFVEGYALNLNQLKSGVDFYRRWRDYNIIFVALFWGLNVVDANVTAHLKTFDLSDSLTLKYEPTLLPSLSGPVPGIRLTMNFRK